MTPDLNPWLALAGIVFGPAGAAWLGVKLSVNGMREDVREIKGDVKELRGEVGKHGERLVKLETKTEAPK